MNIGIVTTWFERGAAYVSRQYARSLQANNSIFIYARGGERPGRDEKDWSGSSVYWGKRPTVPKTTWIEKSDFRKWVWKNKIEAVLFNEQRWWFPLIWCAEMGVKTIAYIDYYTENTIPLFGIYDVLICNTQRHYSAFSWHPCAVYVPWGTEVDIFKPEEKKEDKKGGATVFFHSAGMSPYRKGTDLALEAFSLLPKPKKMIIHSQVDLYSKMPEKSLILRKLESEGSLEIITKTVGAPGLYGLGDVYVYPSRLDGIGLSLVEALSCGLPVVTPDNPPMNEFRDDACCISVPVAKRFCRADGYYWPMCEVDVKELSSAMERVAMRSPGLEALKKAAREYAKDKLDWTKNSRELSNVILSAKTLSVEEKWDYIRMIKEFEYNNRTPGQILVGAFPPFYLYYFFRKLIRRLKS